VKASLRGFSLLEVLVATAIVSISLLVLIQSNATAVRGVMAAEEVTKATLLAQDLMNRALAIADVYGFGENDVNDRGDFEDLYPGEYPGWTWEWVLAKSTLTIPDLSSLFDDAGVDEQSQQQAQAGSLAGVIDPSMLEELLGDYIREVRVTVCFPIGRETQDCVELVSHVINPGGRVAGAEEQAILLERMGSGSLPDILEEAGE
jgi:prepilin-type N-terminal cleavage/methylation domain-containing protein